MPTVAYLANLFPSSLEPYVADEIEELRNRGVRIVAGSVRRPKVSDAPTAEIVLQAMSPLVLVRALWLCLHKWPRLADLICRVAFRGREGAWQRSKALLHTWLGACYAVMLEQYGVDHIHVHHGYFGSWIGMVAARLLNIGFSLTLHGSDLFVRHAYMDAKLKDCSFCLTISEFNRRYILEHYPAVAARKVLVSRLGVQMPAGSARARTESYRGKLKLFAVGRLQAVKNHAFLIHACAKLNRLGLDFECWIAGDGPEKCKLAKLIRNYGLEDQVQLLGHVPHEQMHQFYRRADVVVLTSHSEGIPLALMEAMARRKIVIAPAITGIPELVVSGKTGFLYKAGALPDFIERLLFIRLLLQARFSHYPSHLVSAAQQLDWMRHAAHVQVGHNFNHDQNLKSFGDLFLSRIVPLTERLPHANLVLQQI
jgi:colanic acid/amylovoran biosynthesis glycosyltransferase